MSQTAQLIRAIAFREGQSWIGQCIEYDICVQAATPEDVQKRLVDTVCYEYEYSMKQHGRAFAGIPPAPPKFAEMWRQKSGDFTLYVAPQHETCHRANRVGLEMRLCA